MQTTTMWCEKRNLHCCISCGSSEHPHHAKGICHLCYAIKRYTGLTRDRREYLRKWRQENKDKINKQKKEYGKKNRDAIIAYKKKWRIENPDKVSAFKKKYSLANREKISEKNRLYRLNNLEILREKHRLYKQINKDWLNQRRRNRREQERIFKKQFIIVDEIPQGINFDTHQRGKWDKVIDIVKNLIPLEGETLEIYKQRKYADIVDIVNSLTDNEVYKTSFTELGYNIREIKKIKAALQLLGYRLNMKMAIESVDGLLHIFRI